MLREMGVKSESDGVSVEIKPARDTLYLYTRRSAVSLIGAAQSATATYGHELSISICRKSPRGIFPHPQLGRAPPGELL